VATLLAVELLDELFFGVHEAAWPLIRQDLGLNYAAVGLLLTIPDAVGAAVELAYGPISDAGGRRRLLLAGGLAFAAALLLAASAGGFGMLLVALLVFSPASGAFVGLSQTALIDLDPERHEQAMARWTLAGSVGVAAGPLLLAATVALGGGWRMLFAALGLATLPLVAVVRKLSLPRPVESAGVRAELRRTVAALRRREVLRWLALLEVGDLVGDVFTGYAALYFVDVAGTSPATAALAVALLTGTSLAGDALLVLLLARGVRGLVYLRWSAAALLFVVPAFFVLPGLAKLGPLALVGLFRAGWYAILKARLFSALPGQSGAALSLSSLSGLVGSLPPLLIGLLAQRFGLGAALWLVMLAPLALLAALPRER
jgi:FSR family fosmidomycin resistance protein-like MFS transporter